MLLMMIMILLLLLVVVTVIIHLLRRRNWNQWRNSGWVASGSVLSVDEDVGGEKMERMISSLWWLNYYPHHPSSRMGMMLMMWEGEY